MSKAFYIVIHPDQAKALKTIAARTKYYHDHWIKRYNRWAALNSQPAYKEVSGELSELSDGITFA